MAVNLVSDLKIFQVVTSDLKRIAGSAAPAELMLATGTLDAIMSPENTTGVASLTTEITPLFGKDYPQHNSPSKPRYQVRYEIPTCDYNHDVTTKSDICEDSSSTNPYGFLDVTVDKYAERKFKITLDDFNNLQQTPNERITYEFVKAANEIKVVMNNDTAADLLTLAGDYADGTNSVAATKDLPLFNPTGATFQPIGLAQIKYDYMAGGYNGKPIMIGGSKTPFMQMAGPAAGYGANSLGSAGSAFMPVSVFADMYLDGVAANNEENAITLMPGSVRIVEWYENVGYKQIVMPTQKAVVMNILGIDFDVDMVWVECDKNFLFTVSKRWGLFTIPQEAYDGADNCRRNLLMRWRMACLAAGCDTVNTTSVVV